MRTIIQRVSHAKIEINNNEHSKIGKGLLILLGVCPEDQIEDIQWLASKILNLRIFEDESGHMNLNVDEVGGEILIVSQFTLFASTKKGNRPGFTAAAKPEYANKFYELFAEKIKQDYVEMKVKTGIFGADMHISLENYGPVTIFIDTKAKE